MARTPIHPGEILDDELEEAGLSAKALADVIEVPPNRVYQILSGKRNVTADTELRLGQYFGMSSDFWMNLQSAYELDLARRQNAKATARIPRRSETRESRSRRFEEFRCRKTKSAEDFLRLRAKLERGAAQAERGELIDGDEALEELRGDDRRTRFTPRRLVRYAVEW